jgi:predicted transcriptional regulator
MAKKTTVIHLDIHVDEGYQVGLVQRLQKYGIKQYEVADEMGVTSSQFSRWVARPSEYTGRPWSIRLDNVVKIEKAIIAIRIRKERDGSKPK